jgi:ketosteroid isomerase-like protein
MTTAVNLIIQFYTAFQARDYATMQASYADDATFSDPVFKNLSANEVRAMWEMFCVKGTDLEISFNNVIETSDGGSADWTARYLFSATDRKVTNRIHAKFNIRNGKIIRHVDHFNFYRWSSQALGLTGLLFGWTPMIKSKVQAGARKNLEQFRQRNVK